jgi:hypothetical protein
MLLIGNTHTWIIATTYRFFSADEGNSRGFLNFGADISDIQDFAVM